MIKKWSLTVTILIVVGIVIVGILPSMASQAHDGIQWMSYEEGRQRGATENKKLFLVFNADWCRYCLKMEKETFQDPTVISYVNRNFIPISVNSDRQQKVAAQYGVRGLPSTWFISEKGERIGSQPGYIDAQKMLTILKYIGTDSYLTMSYQAFVEKQD